MRSSHFKNFEVRSSYNLSLEMIISIHIFKWDSHMISHMKWEPLLKFWSKILIWPLTWNENLSSNFEVSFSYGYPLELWTTYESKILIWNENLTSHFEVWFSCHISLEMRTFIKIWKQDSHITSHFEFKMKFS